MSETASGKRKADADGAPSPEQATRARKEPPQDPLPEKTNHVEVEFLFCSYPTHLFPCVGDLRGKIHVSLDQDPATGAYSIPMGKTPFQVKLDDGMKRCLEGWCNEESDYLEFDGSFERNSNGKIHLDSGLRLLHWADEFREAHATVFPKDCGEYPHDARWKGNDEFHAMMSQSDLDKWEKEQGGILKFGAHASINENYCSADATYIVKLYTVISAHKPNEEDLPQYQEGQVPDWDALIRVVAARHPKKGDAWAQNAVRQYKYFLNLKLDKNLESKHFSPSKALDEIWHAHLSFVDRYQRDLLCLTKGEGILEHKPVHVKESYRRYQEAYQEHTKRMDDEGTAVDNEFWPNPTQDLFPEGSTRGDYDHLDTGISDYDVGCG